MFCSRQYPKIIADVGLSDMSYELKWFATKIKLSSDWLTPWNSVLLYQLTPYSSVLYQLTESIEHFPSLSAD
jgi:hypothetical protein